MIPVSAADGYQVDELGELLVSLMPVSPPLYPEGDLTDEPEVTMMGELIREAALEGVRDELPHSLAVVVDEVSEREGRSPENPMLDVHASLYVERPSQKAIVIGKRGRGCARSARAPVSRSRRCSAPASTWTSTSRWPRSGSGTPGSCPSWGSDPVRAVPPAGSAPPD